MTEKPAAILRPATVDDVEQLDRLLRALAASIGDEGFYRGSVEDLRRFGFGQRSHFSAVLAWPDDGSGQPQPGVDAIGTCVFLPDFSTWRGRPGVNILDLVVDSTWRDGGIGLRLMAAAAAHGRQHWNADYLILSVAKTNVGGQRFYERHGFEVDPHIEVMTLNSLDDLLAL